ncbi:MAG: hypothetical protein AAGN35_04090 [Bacteroidota bacterium]
MKTKTKSILALAGTLVIGVVIGVLVAGMVFRARITNFKNLRQGKRFVGHLVRTIDPTPDQREQIHPILENFGSRMEEMHRRHLLEFKANHEELHDELAVHLTEEQMQKLEAELKRMEGRARRMMKPKRRPPKKRRKKNMPGGE